jgi:hypothetical protein
MQFREKLEALLLVSLMFPAVAWSLLVSVSFVNLAPSALYGGGVMHVAESGGPFWFLLM